VGIRGAGIFKEPFCILGGAGDWYNSVAVLPYGAIYEMGNVEHKAQIAQKLP